SHFVNLIVEKTIIYFADHCIISKRLGLMDHIKKYLSDHDLMAKHLGIELLEVGEGRARARMPIQSFHMNSANVVHGGAVFTLADFAFAAASNSHGQLALSISASIMFMMAKSEGS